MVSTTTQRNDGDTSCGNKTADFGRQRAFPSDYVVPVVHVHLPEPVVKVGFYGGLATAVAVGALDWPLVLLAGSAWRLPATGVLEKTFLP